MQLEIIALVYPDRNLSQRHNSSRGSFFERLSSRTLHPILAPPCVEVSSPNPIGSFSRGGRGGREGGRGRAHRVCHHHGSGHCQLLTGERSAQDFPLSDPFQPRWSPSGSHGCRENRKRHLRSRRCDSGASGNEPSQHQKSIHLSGNNFAARSMDPLLARSVSAQESATAVLSCRRQPNPGKWTLRSGAAVHGTCSFRPLSLGAQHGRTRHHPRGPLRGSRSHRDNARSLAWTGSSRISAVANAAGRAACNGTAAAAVVGY